MRSFFPGIILASLHDDGVELNYKWWISLGQFGWWWESYHFFSSCCWSIFKWNGNTNQMLIINFSRIIGFLCIVYGDVINFYRCILVSTQKNDIRFMPLFSLHKNRISLALSLEKSLLMGFRHMQGQAYERLSLSIHEYTKPGLRWFWQQQSRSHDKGTHYGKPFEIVKFVIPRTTTLPLKSIIYILHLRIWNSFSDCTPLSWERRVITWNSEFPLNEVYWMVFASTKACASSNTHRVKYYWYYYCSL